MVAMVAGVAMAVGVDGDGTPQEQLNSSITATKKTEDNPLTNFITTSCHHFVPFYLLPLRLAVTLDRYTRHLQIELTA
jgi:hypothetical protein